MSKFLKALEQAQRDRALAAQGRSAAPPAPPTAAPPAAAPVARPAAAPPAAPPASAAPPPRPAPPRPMPPPPMSPPTDFRRPTAVHAPVEIPEGVDDHLVSLVDPTGFEAEQYRALRYMLEQKRREEGLTVIAVSSPGAGDGKTTTAINLAGALAQAPEARVLLIEADLRQPSIGDHLGFGPSGVGLVHAILNPALSIAQVARPRPPFNLSVVLAGQAPPSPYEILKSPRLGELIEEARASYDYVIIDTPPLVAFQDSRVITRAVDGIIVVVSAHRTPKRMLEEALNVVDPAKMLGFVFNADDQGLARFYNRHYYMQSATRKRKPSWGKTLRKVGTSFAKPARSRSSSADGDDDTE